MFSRNVKLAFNDGAYVIMVKDPELDELYKKYSGAVHVEIKRPQDAGTDSQNRAMHSLLAEYYASGCHSAPDGYTLDQFKSWLKKRYGVWFELEVDGEKFNVLKSWADYTKEERSNFIEKLIAEIELTGANNQPKIQEILQTMADNSLLTGGKA